VLRWREIDKPFPKRGEVLIKLRATTVTSADWRVRSLTMPRGFGVFARLAFGVTKPRQRILGSELAGDIEAVGEAVRGFKAGDAVFAFTGARMGCHAPYRCVAADGALALKPPNLGYDAVAALSFGGTTALDFLRRAKLQRGDSVLLNGASGAVGTAMLQLAHHAGAHVTAVCSGANAAWVQALGAARVIDYTQVDFAREGQRYDVIIDTVGTAPYARAKPALKPGGRLLLVLCGLPELLRAPWVSRFTRHNIIAGPAAERADDMRQLAALAQAGVFKPVIDRRYAFEDIVEAHRYVDSGRKKGNVVITFAQ